MQTLQHEGVYAQGRHCGDDEAYGYEEPPDGHADPVLLESWIGWAAGKQLRLAVSLCAKLVH